MLRNRLVNAAAFLAFYASVAIAESNDREGNWTIATGEDPATSYRSFVSLEQESVDTIKDQYATRDVHAVLVFRCALGDAAIAAHIDWRRFISSFNTEIGFGVDGGKMLWQKWGVDASNRITQSKTAADAQALVELLVTGSELMVEVTPYAESPLTVRFDLAGLSQGLDTLRKDCQ